MVRSLGDNMSYVSKPLATFLKRARHIRRTLGMRSAAGFMRNNGMEFEAAHLALLGYAPRIKGGM